MINEKEAEELDRGFEFVLDELLTLKTNFDISSNKLFEHIVTLQKEAKNVCLAPHGEVKTERVRLEVELVLPKADVDGLRFNRQEVNACFEKDKDGWYYSEDILFLSARNVKDDNSRDILKEYLNTIEIREQLAGALGVSPEDVEVALPEEPRGVKKYNGVDWWYWLVSPDSTSTTYFWSTAYNGRATYAFASVFGGCAPAFRVKGTRLIEGVKA